MEQQKQLKKCSTERLRLGLVQAGEKEDTASQMDGPKLLEASASVSVKEETVYINGNYGTTWRRGVTFT